MQLFWQHWRYHAYDNRTYWLWLVASGGLLFGTLLLCDALLLDDLVQRFFYLGSKDAWLVDRYNRWLRDIFYYGAKYSIIAFGSALILTTLFAWQSNQQRYDIKALLFVITCMAIIPSVAALLKSLTAMPCPYQLSTYGGAYAPRDIFHFWGYDASLLKAPRCFPASHPSGGFSLLAMVAVSPRKPVPLVMVLLYGVLMSGYQMARGAHFLSHCIATLCLSVILITLIHFLFSRLPSAKA